MLLSDTNGQNTIGDSTFYDAKFFDGLAESKRYFSQLIEKTEVMNAGYHSGSVHVFPIIGDLPVTGMYHIEGAPVTALDPAITEQRVVVQEYVYKINLTSKLKALAQIDIGNIFRKKLARHAAETDDRVAYDMCFANTNFVCNPKPGALTTQLEFSTNGAPITPNTGTSLTLDHVLKAVSKLNMMRTPKMDEKFWCIGTAASLAAIKKELLEVNKYTESGIKNFVHGWAGESYGVVFIEQNNIVTEDVFFGGDEAGIKVMVEPEHIEIGNNSELNTRQEIGWRAIYGYSKIQNNRVLRFDGNPSDV